MPKAKNDKLQVAARSTQRLVNELAAVKKELRIERRWRKKLQRAVLAQTPREWEYENLDLEELKAKAVFKPSILEIIDSLQ